LFSSHNLKKSLLKDLLSNLELKLSTNWTIDDDCVNEIHHYAHLLFEFGISHSDLGAKFIQIIFEQPLLDMLIKFTMIHSAIQNNKHITIKQLKIAYCDCIEALQLNLNCIRDYCENFYHYNIKKDEVVVLEWLESNGSLDKDTASVSIKKLQEYISSIFNITIRGARKRYSELLRKKLIDSEQDTSHSSKVWITFKGKKALMGVIKKKPSKRLKCCVETLLTTLGATFVMLMAILLRVLKGNMVQMT